MILTLIQGLIFIIYVAFIWKKFGVLQSVSDSWYKLKELGGLWYKLFTLFCWGLAIPMLFQSDNPSSLFVYSGAGFAFVGAATMFKLKDTFVPYIHFGGAAVGIILALLGIGLERYGWLPLIVFGIATILIKLLKVKNSTWWIEIVAFVTALTGLLIY
jgi:hypothetical protein